MDIRSHLLDIDLDYFNYTESPVEDLTEIIEALPRNLHSCLILEHHRLLEEIDYWMKRGILLPGYKIYHVDEHHDLYDFGNKKRLPVDCGNFFYHLPPYFSKFIWVAPARRLPSFEGWKNGKHFLQNNGVDAISTVKKSWNPDKIAAVSFTISPDYCGMELSELREMIDMIVSYFNMKHTWKCKPKHGSYKYISWWNQKEVKTKKEGVLV